MKKWVYVIRFAITHIQNIYTPSNICIRLWKLHINQIKIKHNENHSKTHFSIQHYSCNPLWNTKQGKHFLNPGKKYSCNCTDVWCMSCYSQIGEIDMRLSCEFVLEYFPFFLMNFGKLSTWILYVTAWMNSHKLSKMWHKITHWFPNFSYWTIEVWKCVNNFVPHFTIDVITYPWWD